MVLRNNTHTFTYVYRAFTVFGRPFQCRSTSRPRACVLPYNPVVHAQRFGLFPFRSPLLGESSLFLRVLRCFSSPGSLLITYVFSDGYVGMPPRGFPHSDILGSNGRTHLTEAFRSVPRPSSAVSTKASTMRP